MADIAFLECQSVPNTAVNVRRIGDPVATSEEKRNGIALFVKQTAVFPLLFIIHVSEMTCFTPLPELAR